MAFTPWLTMWVRPAATIRSIIEHNPSKGIYVLSTTLALENLFFYGNMWSLGLWTNFPILICIGLFLCPYLGYLWIHILSHVFHFVGKWFHGTAPLLHLRAAIAWAKIPAFGILASWICMILISPQEAFIYVGGGNPILDIFHILNFVFAVWSFFLMLFTIKEVQKFSLGRTIVYSFVSWSLFSIPAWCILLLIVYLLRF